MSDACYCDYEQAVWCRTTEPKARKIHRCSECHGPIPVGENYEYAVGKWDYVQQYRTCRACMALRQYVNDLVPCFCWAYGQMREDARNTIDEYRRELSGMWFGWARHEVKARHRHDEFRRQRAAI